MEAYLDNSATTKPCKQAIDAMCESMRLGYYNPSALYPRAVEADAQLKVSRAVVAQCVGMRESNVVFTSGGTESDNLAIMGHMMGERKGGAILYTAAEHPAVKNACLEAAALYGATAAEIPLTQRGSVDLRAYEALLQDERVRLICAMQVCNETGAILPLKRMATLRDRLAPQAALHVDGVQGFLRQPISMTELGVQSYAVSAHKVHGPKGVGALIFAEGYRLRPLMVGGGQQRNLRSGTENTAGAVGLMAAIRQYPHPSFANARMQQLKDRLLELLKPEIPGLTVLGPQPGDEDAAPHILCVSFPPVRAETMMLALAEDGVYIGTGSACSSKKGKRSAVLTAMGVDPMLIDSSVRFSFCPQNTLEEIEYAAERVIAQYKLLSKFRRR